MDIKIKAHITSVATPWKGGYSICCTMNMVEAIAEFSDRVNGDYRVKEFLERLKEHGAELVELRTSSNKEELIATVKFFSKKELDAFYAAHA